MKIELQEDGVLHATVTITHRGKTLGVDHMIIDTGAAESLISNDVLEGLFGEFEPDDVVHWVSGIGGREPAIRRRVDEICFNGVVIDNFRVDCVDLNRHPGINGLIGLDLLLAGGFIIDLNRREICPA